MTDNVVRGEVQRKDDPFGIPACFYWTMDEVADWVDSIGYGKYKVSYSPATRRYSGKTSIIGQ